MTKLVIRFLVGLALVSALGGVAAADRGGIITPSAYLSVKR
jgi:hypothetical protein